MRSAERSARLASELDRLYHDYNREDSAADPADREIAGFCAAALAFGRVSSVIASIQTLLRIMGPSPAAYVRRFDPGASHPELHAMVHRWTRGVDLAALIWILRQVLEGWDSIERFFVSGLEPAAVDVGPALDRFSERALALDLRAVYGTVPKRAGVCSFFPWPSAGSACKRLNLYLRWMARRDEVDLGVWRRLPPARLIVPLDTHVIRLARCLRLTRYTSPGWKMAADITASLRRLDPGDPVRFDFSLCHVGMMGACGFGRAQGDRQCPLKGLCTPRGRQRR